MNEMQEIALVIFPVLCIVAWLMFLLLKRAQMKTQLRLQRQETFNKMIDKFSSSEAFVEFLKTEQGEKILEDPLMISSNPLKNVIRFIQVGVLLLFLGFALILNAYSLQTEMDPNFVNKMRDYYYYGYSVCALGIGSLVVALVSYILGIKWKLLEK